MLLTIEIPLWFFIFLLHLGLLCLVYLILGVLFLIIFLIPTLKSNGDSISNFFNFFINNKPKKLSNYTNFILMLVIWPFLLYLFYFSK